jgi:hypothetical protein
LEVKLNAQERQVVCRLLTERTARLVEMTGDTTEPDLARRAGLIELLAIDSVIRKLCCPKTGSTGSTGSGGQSNLAVRIASFGLSQGGRRAAAVVRRSVGLLEARRIAGDDSVAWPPSRGLALGPEG